MKKLIAILSILTLVFITFAACSGSAYEDEEPTAISIVLGNHANSYGLNLSNPDVTAAVAKAAANGYISVIRCDGKPALISADIYTIPEQYRGADQKKLDTDARQRAAKILAGLTEVKAQEPELNTLEALWQAVRSLAAAPVDSLREIVVIDTGLSTSGVLDFRNNLLEADPNTIAELLAEKSAIPDFTDITVRWFQLGDVVLPQPALSHAQVSQLKNIWAAIIEKGGGTAEFSDMAPVPQALDPAEYPEISIVKLPPEASLSFDPVKATVFDERQVRFIGDTARYADPAAVKVALRSAADYIISHPDFKSLLIGTTASGNKEFCMQLSKDRADAVSGTLVSMGVPEKQLVTLGLGFNDPWHIADMDLNGDLIEKFAAQNRKVVLMDANSRDAKELLDGA